MKNNKVSTDSYKKERVTKGIWYRIVSVLSAITVFCTTYALILPAITMEDPTLGVKLNNKFEFESELLDIDFYVSGRAIFKDKDVDIENPVGDLVDLHVTVLDKDNKAYEDYEAYAVENIGAEDVAQVTALKLKFTYMGHELNMNNCDIKAEINAKEVFFTDIIGSVPDDIYYTSTNHPMATPNEDILPLAKALTVAQSTTTELAELPVVYTSDASEVSTLTVDVKGNSLAMVTSSVDDYWFKVAYYVEVDKPVFVPHEEMDTTQYKYFKFNDRRNNIDLEGYIDLSKDDGHIKGDNIKYAQLVPYDSNKTTPESGDLFVFERKPQSIMAYRTEKLKFSEHNSLLTVNKLANSDNYADPTLYTNVTGVKDPYVNNEDEENHFPYTFECDIEDVFEQDDETGKKIDRTSYNFELLFSNIPGSGSRIYIQEDSTLVLVYKASDSQKKVRDDVTLIDYDISDGEMTEEGAVRTDDRGINSIYSKTAGGAKFMFGEAWAFTGDLRSDHTKVNSLNKTNLFKDRLYYINDNVVNTNGTYSDNSSYETRHFLYDLVYDVNTSDGDFVPVFDSAFSTPDLFSTTNDYIPDTLEKDDLLVKDDLIGAYKCGDDYFVKNGHGNNMDKWNPYVGNGSYLIFNNLTTNSGYTSGSDLRNINRDDYVEIPREFVNKDTGFTIEFKFGQINLENVTSDFFNILSVNERYVSGDEGIKFNLYIDRSKNELRINSVGQIKKNLKVADAKLVDNGTPGEKRCDLLTNSTLSITYDCKDEDVLRIYIDGVEVFSYKASLGSLGLTKNLILGTNRQFAKATYESRRIRIQIKEIRIYERALRSTGVAQNAKYDGNYAPTVSDGLVAEYDADTVDKGETGSWQAVSGSSKAEITMADDVNYNFNGKGCVVTGTAKGNTISIPQDVLNRMTGSDFTIEIEFGNVKNISHKTQYIGAGTLNTPSQEFIIWSYGKTDKEDRQYRLSLALDGAYTSYQLNNGESLKDDISADSVSYSTLSFVYDQTNSMTYVYVNGVQIAENGSMFQDGSGDGMISLEGLAFGPNTEGSVVEYRTIRFYNRALKHHEVVQNSMHDGTYNAGKFQYTNNGVNTMTNGTNTDSFGSMGKTVIGGREIEFIREGDKYILSSINVSSYNRKEVGDGYKFTYGNETDLDKFVYYGVNSFQSSNWPLDHTKTYDAGQEIFGHDVLFGSTYDEYKKRYPYSGYEGSPNPPEPPWSGSGGFNNPNAWEYFLTTSDGENHNAFFAMKYKIDFILDKDYVGDLEYLFQGDDDLWILLKDNNNGDTNLVVDIGGIHASEGQIVDLWNYIKGGRYGERSEGDYTLYVFLLERGAKASTCYMEFTIPAIASLRESEATGGLAISKTVENVVTDQVFDFTIRFDRTFAGGMYTITRADGETESPVQFGTDMDNDDNIFDGSLKIELYHGDVVVVSGVPLGVTYTVTEKSDIYYHTSYKKNLETLREGNVAEGVISATMDRFVFYNTMGVELPATGESGVVAYFIPFIVATAWMFTMPYMDKTNKWRAKGRKREE